MKHLSLGDSAVSWENTHPPQIGYRVTGYTSNPPNLPVELGRLLYDLKSAYSSLPPIPAKILCNGCLWSCMVVDGHAGNERLCLTTAQVTCGTRVDQRSCTSCILTLT